MSSKTEICNVALSHLNIGKEIANVETEQSQEASACRRYFDLARKSVLRDFAWPFATRFATLSLVEEDPTDEWDYSYRYPVDCVKLRRFVTGYRNENRQERQPYRVVGDDSGLLIFCDIESAEIEYTKNHEDVQMWPSDFSMALSFRLAAYIAPRLTSGDPFKLGEKCLTMYRLEMSAAQANAVNEEQVEELPQSEFIRARD